MTGKQVRLFLVDGTPGGLTTAEITNWTGHVMAAPRSELGDLLKRAEASRTGVYMLLGDDDTSVGGVRCYIGEADVVAARLKSHLGTKAFWDRVVIITSKDANLTKAHGRYLESKLITLARLAGRASLENGTEPPLPPLPEADASDMDYFLDQLQIVLPVLGINAVRVRAVKPPVRPTDGEDTSPVFRLQHAKLGVDARAQQIDGEFTLLAGSTVAGTIRTSAKYSETTARAYAAFRARQQKLIADGSIVVTGAVGKVVRDIVFNSPSTAGAIVLGRSCNGRDAWTSSEGTFGQWESRGVE